MSQQFSFWLKALPYLVFAAVMLCGVDTGISPFELQREGVFPAPPPDSAGNARPSLRWGGPFGSAQDRLIPAYHRAHHRKMRIAAMSTFTPLMNCCNLDMNASIMLPAQDPIFRSVNSLHPSCDKS